MPWSDPQFWIVTAVAAVGVWLVIRPLLPKRSGSHPCGGCASGAAAQRAKKTALTVEGKRVS